MDVTFRVGDLIECTADIGCLLPGMHEVIAVDEGGSPTVECEAGEHWVHKEELESGLFRPVGGPW